MQPEFQALVHDAFAQCQTRFAPSFAAAYLHGSISQGDAIPGVSDLDFFLILSTSPNESEHLWLSQTAGSLERRFPVVDEVHLTVQTLDNLKRDSFARFALKYNASLLAGTDVISLLEQNGIPTPAPDAAWARQRLSFARQCFTDALIGKQPACTGPLPKNALYISRKFARYFVVIEGSYFLMAKGRFTGFKKESVLAALRQTCPGFESTLDDAERVLNDALSASLMPDEFLCRIRPWVEWMFDQIENS